MADTQAVATSDDDNDDEAVDKTHPPGIPYKYCGITRFVQTHMRDKPDILCVFTHRRTRISSGRQTTLDHQYVVIKYYSGPFSPRGSHRVFPMCTYGRGKKIRCTGEREHSVFVLSVRVKKKNKMIIIIIVIEKNDFDRIGPGAVSPITCTPTVICRVERGTRDVYSCVYDHLQHLRIDCYTIFLFPSFLFLIFFSRVIRSRIFFACPPMTF
jgi:hypothetical protein